MNKVSPIGETHQWLKKFRGMRASERREIELAVTITRSSGKPLIEFLNEEFLEVSFG